MPLTLFVSGVFMQTWNGVQIGYFDETLNFHQFGNWNWSAAPHQHYEVFRYPQGSYWVPVSTHPPGHAWNNIPPVLVVGGNVRDVTCSNMSIVNPNGSEYRPSNMYIWIPYNSIPNDIVPGCTVNKVYCTPPLN